MDKIPLSQEQVEEILEALEEEEFEDETDFDCLSGDGKTTSVEVEIDSDGKVKMFYSFLNDDCSFGLPSPIYQHTLKVLDYVFTGEEEEDCYVDWHLKSDKYKMPEDKELLEELTDALEEHKEECYFGLDSYSVDDVYDEWDEDELREIAEEGLSGGNYVLIDDELYCYDSDVKEVLENLGLDEDTPYQLITFEEAVDYLLDHDIELI